MLDVISSANDHEVRLSLNMFTFDVWFKACLLLLHYAPVVLINWVLVQSKIFITSLVITEYSISYIKLLATDLFPLKFTLYNRIFT